jgi:metal-dependent HD superfamily phosphatase/phosphodiesterase
LISGISHHTFFCGGNLVTLDDVKNNPKVAELIAKADEYLGIIGYTEHGDRHCSLAASIAYNIMIRLGKGERRAQLAAIAGYLHDIGNVINRDYHAQTASVIAMDILGEMGMSYADILEIAAAIGNHDEKDGMPISDICAAVILADKSDVHQSR